ncbi:MAG: 4Fe-4S dicluster domain-containing protein, partial [Alphaproteobacteria bacterium]|nr:4Fe-4S dicluster domain-containing protein [Alphaproteobacteria bacterium]
MGSPLRSLMSNVMPLSRWRVGCESCLAVCPIGALSFSDDRIDVSQACFGCGRCAAACPTGALEVEGFVNIPDEVSIVEGAIVRLECERVPIQDLVPGATTVPCLGGLGTNTLLELIVSSEGRSIRLVDRGLCAGCPASGKGLSLGGIVASALLALQKTGCDPDVLPVLLVRPLPMERRNDERAGSGGLSRRSLFRRMSRDVSGQPTDDPMFPPAARKMAEAAALLRFEKRSGRSLPANFPVAVVSKSCGDYRVCVAACPTGALAVEDRGASRELIFSPAR